MMFTDPGCFAGFAYGDLNTLRIEAMSIFERCCKDGTPAALLAFVEQQIAKEPPPIQLLGEIAEDLHRRLQSLRQLQFELRAYTLHTLRDDFGIDLSPLFPLNGFDHQMSVDVIMGRLLPGGAPDEVALRHTLETAFEASGRVLEDILLVESMYNFLADWTTGLSVRAARESHGGGIFDIPHTRLH
jgi:hypothetical protein